MTSNLDATAVNGDTYSTQATIYDSLGAAHQVTFTYTNADVAAVCWRHRPAGDRHANRQRHQPSASRTGIDRGPNVHLHGHGLAAGARIQ